MCSFDKNVPQNFAEQKLALQSIGLGGIKHFSNLYL